MHFDVPETDLIRWRRYLHEHPELAYREEATSAYVEQELRAIGVDGIERPVKTSLVAWVKGTKPTDKPTKTVATSTRSPWKRPRTFRSNPRTPASPTSAGMTPTWR